MAHGYWVRCPSWHKTLNVFMAEDQQREGTGLCPLKTESLVGPRKELNSLRGPSECHSLGHQATVKNTETQAKGNPIYHNRCVCCVSALVQQQSWYVVALYGWAVSSSTLNSATHWCVNLCEWVGGEMRKVSPVHLPIPTRLKSSQCVCVLLWKISRTCISAGCQNTTFCREGRASCFSTREKHVTWPIDMWQPSTFASWWRILICLKFWLRLYGQSIQKGGKGARSTTSTTDSNQNTQGQGVQTVHFRGHLSPAVITSRHPDRFLAKGLGHGHSLKTYSDIRSLKLNLFSNLTAYKRSHVSAFPQCDWRCPRRYRGNVFYRLPSPL